MKTMTKAEVLDVLDCMRTPYGTASSARRIRETVMGVYEKLDKARAEVERLKRAVERKNSALNAARQALGYNGFSGIPAFQAVERAIAYTGDPT